MTRREQQPFYRSEITRWAFVVTGLFLAYDLSPWAPHAWHQTPSLVWLHPLLPFAAIAFLIYAGLLFYGSVEAAVVADFLGLFLYLVELVALIATANAQHANPWVFVAFFLVCVLHFAAGRLALYQRESG